MKNSGEAIEKVLEGLRNVDVPPGMELRILHAAEDHALLRQQSIGWRMRAMWQTMPVATGSLVGVVLANLFVAALAIPLIHRLRDEPMQFKTKAAMPELQPLAASEKVTIKSRPLPLKSSAQPTKKPKGQRPSLVYDSDSLALSEMRAASHPAPPMPLTEQEKLMLRIVHRGDPVEMAMLNPEMRAKQVTESKEEFQKFFGRSASRNHE